MSSLNEKQCVIGLISISDRASQAIYSDEGLPALEAWLHEAIIEPFVLHKKLIPDEKDLIEKTLIEMSDDLGCDLILTTGGTGPSRRDVTPEATLNIATKVMPGFGEQMRQISLHFVPTAILSRQVGVIRETPNHACLIINLPGRPRAIRETLQGLPDNEKQKGVTGIFASIPYCLELMGNPVIHTHDHIIKAFRPKK
ncbi:MAG: molybdopterin adenylyltransferase [Bdellovibrio sp.]|nr:molybdopterin adenylyltransferase [Bdellovibrio sp.]